jgi:hypothetical protein
LKAVDRGAGLGIEAGQRAEVVLGGLDGTGDAGEVGGAEGDGVIALGIETEGERAELVGDIAVAALEGVEGILAAAVDVLNLLQALSDLGGAAIGARGLVADASERGFELFDAPGFTFEFGFGGGDDAAGGIELVLKAGFGGTEAAILGIEPFEGAIEFGEAVLEAGDLELEGFVAGLQGGEFADGFEFAGVGGAGGGLGGGGLKSFSFHLLAEGLVFGGEDGGLLFKILGVGAGGFECGGGLSGLAAGGEEEDDGGDRDGGAEEGGEDGPGEFHNRAPMIAG